MAVRHFIGIESLDLRYVDGRDALVVSPEFGFVTSDGREIIMRRVRRPRWPLNIESDEHGFLTDGGTIPRFAWPLVGHPFGRWLPAFLVHDYDWSFRTVSFEETNRTLAEALDTLGCPALTRRLIVGAVAHFGGGIWRRGRAHNNELDFHYGKIS